MSGLLPVLRKEAIQMLRDRGTLRFALLLPAFQLILFGLIDTNVKDVPTSVLDQTRTAESRSLLQDFRNTGTFSIVAEAESLDQLREQIVAGQVSVGIAIPPDFGRKRRAGQPGHVLVLIDGSDSTISSQTLLATEGLSLTRSIQELRERVGPVELGIRPHPQLLFNPDSRSANLLIPGLIAILLTFSGTLLASFSIVRERERGTLEQLMVTPVSPVAVILGKLLPYLFLGFIQLLFVLFLMTTVFRVPIHGSLTLLLGLSFLYLLALLSLGLLVSSWARTQMEAIQIAQMFLLPSIMLSGYIFPLRSLPRALQVVSQFLPATHFISIARAIIVRGAPLRDLWPDVVALLVIASVLVASSTRAFRKTVS